MATPLSPLDAGSVWRLQRLNSFAARAKALGLLSDPQVVRELEAMEAETEALEELSNLERRGERQPNWWEVRSRHTSSHVRRQARLPPSPPRRARRTESTTKSARRRRTTRELRRRRRATTARRTGASPKRCASPPPPPRTTRTGLALRCGWETRRGRRRMRSTR